MNTCSSTHFLESFIRFCHYLVPETFPSYIYPSHLFISHHLTPKFMSIALLKGDVPKKKQSPFYPASEHVSLSSSHFSLALLAISLLIKCSIHPPYRLSYFCVGIFVVVMSSFQRLVQTSLHIQSCIQIPGLVSAGLVIPMYHMPINAV